MGTIDSGKVAAKSHGVLSSATCFSEHVHLVKTCTHLVNIALLMLAQNMLAMARKRKTVKASLFLSWQLYQDRETCEVVLEYPVAEWGTVRSSIKAHLSLESGASEEHEIK
uniref:Uncharacterized protein n=1 Tax=Sphaerodactylus townsendi TaxID=933632 RepID=A0ACB8EM45_9SAUR